MKLYRFEPVGLDLFDRKAYMPIPGDLVYKTQPYGTPRNGTMGMAYVNDAETDEFRGLVLLASLAPAKKRKETR